MLRLAFISVLAVFFAFRPVVQAQKVRLGVPLPLSGDGADEGQDLKQLLIFGSEKLANNGYDFVFEDDQCSDKQAVTIAQKFVNLQHLKYVIGFSCSGTVLASAPVYERGKVLAMSVATWAPAILASGEYVYRTMPNFGEGAKLLYEYIAKRHKTLGLLSEETGYAQELALALRGLASDRRMRVLEQNYLSDTTDFRTLLSKMQYERVNALMLNPQTASGLVRVFKQLLDLKWQVPLYGFFFP
jgi:branched-chain amino acid transport system substrate-binding protein